MLVALGTAAIGWAPRVLFTGTTPTERLAPLVAHETLLRYTIVGEAAMYIAFLAVALTLHRLLAPTHRLLAAAMATLALTSVPFGFVNVTYLLDLLRLVQGPITPQTLEQITVAYERYRAGALVQSIPWGLWLLPFGLLVIRSGFLPRLLGGLLLLAGLGYVAHFGGRVLFPGYRESVWPRVFSAPRVAEIGIAGWLLLFGARRTPFERRSAPPVARATASG